MWYKFVIRSSAECLIQGAESSGEEITEVFHYDSRRAFLDTSLDMRTVAISDIVSGLIGYLLTRPVC